MKDNFINFPSNYKFKNLIGQKFGRLLVINYAGLNKNRASIWECLCDCTNIVKVVGSSLKSKNTTSCGCYQKDKVKETKTKDLSGQYFHRLFVIKKVNKDNKKLKWECLCTCKNVVEVFGNDLVSEKTRSCGCLQKEIAIETAKKYLKNIKPPGMSSWKSLYLNYKNKAKKKNREFLLSLEDFINLCSKNCFYCNDPPKNYNSSKKAKDMTEEGINRQWIFKNGLDRIDNNEGYIVANCVPCCGICNFMKRKLTVEQFKEHITKISNNWTKGKNNEKSL